MSSIAISKLPKIKDGDLYHWADYIELLCLINKDNTLSQNDFVDRLKPKRDLEDSDDFGTDKKNIQINEKNSLLAEDCFKLIEYRSQAFKQYYPFKLSDDSKVISRKKTLSKKHKFYLSLLFSSQLGVFKDYKSKLTSSFEVVSHKALQSILPVKAKSLLFGSSNIEDIEDADQRSAKLFDKIKDLATNIKEQVNIKKEELSKYDNGDGGLDVYGWLDLGDTNPHIPLFFCQCACTPKWIVKQNSSKFDKWNSFVSLSTSPLSFIFIPFSFRSATGEWHQKHKIERTILIDRERLVHCLDNNLDVFISSKSNEVVEEVLQFKEGTV